MEQKKRREQKRERDKRNHQLKAYYSKIKSDDKGLQINIAHVVFLSSEISVVEHGAPLRPIWHRHLYRRVEGKIRR